MSSVYGGKPKEVGRRVECSRALGWQQRTTDLRRAQVLTKTREKVV